MTLCAGRENGQATVMAAVMLPIFCGFLGLAIDVGSFYSVKRQLQVAADASARAAILELKRRRPGSMSAAARDAATINGFTSGVTMNYPPQAGPHAGDVSYVEVIISKQAPTMLMRFVVSKQTAEVRGRAVAGLIAGVPPAGIFVLNRTRSRSLEVQGGASLTSDLDVWVSSNSGSGVSVTAGSCMTAPSIGVTGGYEGSCYSSAPIGDMIPDEDPLADLAEPASGGGCDFTNLTLKNETRTLAPGVYCGGLEVSQADAYLQPGLYVMRGGGLEVSHHATMHGTGVSFYITGDATYEPGNVTIDSNASVVLSAPASGPQAGVLFFFDRTLAPQSLQMEIASSADTSFEGTIYALNQHVHYHSGTKHNGASPWMIMVADTLAVTNGSDLEIAADFEHSVVPPPFRLASLVE